MTYLLCLLSGAAAFMAALIIAVSHEPWAVAAGVGVAVTFGLLTLTHAIRGLRAYLGG